MGELVDVVGIFHITNTLGHPLDPLHSGILAASDVGDVVVTLILDRTHRIDIPGGGIDIFEILPGASLITHAPDYDAGVIIVGGNHLDHPRDMGVLPLYRVGKGGISITVVMTLDVGLVHKVYSVLVAEEIPIGIVGVVRITDMVDVGPLHEADIFFHHFPGDRMSHGRLRLMAVDTTKFDWFSIEIEILPGEAEFIFFSWSLFNAYFPETNNCREYVKSLPGSVFQLTHKGVAPGSLRRPRLRLGIIQDTRGGLAREIGDKVVVVRI